MFEPTILNPNPSRRARYIDIMEAALQAVDPFRAVQAALTLTGATLRVDGQLYDMDRFKRVVVIGAGKAATPMTRAVEARLERYISAGLVVTKTGHGGATRRIEIVEASHPSPDADGVAAGRRILDLVDQAAEEDLVLALISGGGSALLVAPADGITLSDLQLMTATLLACGATINEVNCLRKHCSALKGGQLARAAAPATLITLVLSDVVGNPLDVIASGPTVPDSSTWSDAWSIVEKYAIADSLPGAVVRRLRAGLSGQIEDTPHAGDPVFVKTRTTIVGDNRVAALAALRKATALGYHALLLSTFVEGEAAIVAKLSVALGREIESSGNPVNVPGCLILGGETTVTLGENPGQGGRNQELALAAAVELAGMTGVTIAALATDGTDGPTDSAGGLVDGGTIERAHVAGLDAAKHLATHDAYPLLAATGDLLRTGPTQTNVNDLIFVFVE